MKRTLRYLCCGTALAAMIIAGTGCTKEVGRERLTPAETKHTEDTEEERADASDEASDETSDETPVKTSGTPLTGEGTVGDLNYSIVTDSSSSENTDRGYYIFDSDEDGLSYYVIISSGEKNTGGYDIFVTDISYDGIEAVITVCETSPGPTDMVFQAFTYPCCAVRFNKLPEKIKVVSEDGKELDLLYRRLSYTTIEDGWIAFLAAGSGEMTRETYVYETGDGRYRYVNVESVTQSWGSSKWNHNIIGFGIVDSKEDIVSVAEEFGSCGYVAFHGDMTTPHTVQEFLDS